MLMVEVDSDDGGIDLSSIQKKVDEDGPFADRGGHDVSPDDEIDYDLSENKVHDLVKYVRSNTIRNEQQFVVVTLGYISGYMARNDDFVSGVIIGTSSSGKTHLQGKVEDLFPRDHMYMATSGTDKSLIYDEGWENAYIASLDELQKPGQQIIEFLKSVHGDDDEFIYKATQGSVKDGFSVEEITRTAKPYWFLYAQYEPDFEMWNRLLKVPVHESESKNRAVFRMAGQIRHIQIGNGEEEYNYEFVEGERALQRHIASIPEETSGYVALPNGQNVEDWAVADIIEPIFNHSRSESNRAYDMVYNLIKASALMNYPNRETREVVFPNGEVHDAIIVEPQDVANVLACRDVLLATTHELDRKKKAVCNAIKTKGGMTYECERSKIQEYLRESDASMIKGTELDNILRDLEDNYLIYIHENASDNNTHIYEFLDWGELNYANVDEYAYLFEDTYDPVTGEPFIEAHERIKKEIEPNAADFMKGANTEVSSKDVNGQTTFGSEKRSITLDPHEDAVRELMRAALNGRRIDGLNNVPIEKLIGLVDMDEDPELVNIEGTILDPTHDVWYQPDRADQWVETEQDARREVKRAIRTLLEKRVVIADTEMEKGEVVSAEITVLSEADL